MKIHHLRNATLVIEVENEVILVDPMLSKKGEASPPFTLFRFKPQRNRKKCLTAQHYSFFENY
jgi:L-ascorbate metabolism protein UlaG (beta-lactamase superfamily)